MQFNIARIGLLIVCFCVFSQMSLARTSHSNLVQQQVDGVFDFTHWHSGDGAVPLDGRWAFYWQKQLSPHEWQTLQAPWFDLPATWDKEGASQSVYNGKGFATFTAKLINLPSDTTWGLIIPEQSTAFRLFINDDLVAEGGIAGVSFSSSEAYSGNQFIKLGELPANSKITWHVSNFHHASGGPWQTLIMGSYYELGLYHVVKTFDQALVVALALLTSLFLIIQHFIDRREKASALLSAFALVIAVRVGIMDNQVLYQLLGVLPWQLHIRVLYFTMLIAAPLILYWQHNTFPAELSENTARRVGYAFLPALISIIIFPSAWFTELLMPFQFMLVVVIAIYFWSLVKVILHKRRGGYYIVCGALLLSLAILHDIALYAQWLEDGRLWLTYGLLAFLLSLAVNMLYLRAEQKQQVESLSEQLMTANKQLKARVAQRTIELAEKADALEEANEKLQLLANIDDLTGVLNRRAFVEQLEMFARIKPDVALIMIDIDYFKRVNDAHGREVGDQVLKRLSSVLLDAIRGNDRVGRFGGEEFIILLQDISTAGLNSYCQRLLKEINDIDFSDIAPLAGITVSMGTTMGTLVDRNIDQLIQQADEAMYYVKNHGRNSFRHYTKQ
ncbi:Response regulator receiver protein [Oleispira antarctica RB-8]|uniref:diguanylate cyclase n=1 Tax=Oleispira antarctica RB-8 TaxID=698738 RepID=R4YKM6_OLEAN|nr:Response regulator receiver protein [Oleispira antarctica RB-8]